MPYTPKFALEYQRIMSALAKAESALKAGDTKALYGLHGVLAMECAGRKYVLANPRNKARLESALEALALLAPAEEPACLIAPASYGNLEWELKAPRKGDDKLLYTFDKHQERVKALGMRTPLPSEVFGLLADNLEGKLKGDLKAAADDMFLSYGEWFALAEKRQKDNLIVYVNPRGLIWNGKGYAEDNFSSDSEKKFDIAGIPSGEWVDLSRFKDDFVKWFYSRSFDKLPNEMREGGRRAQVWLPPEGEVWPVGRNSFDGRFDINGNYYGRASRGVSRGERSEHFWR